MSSPTTPPLGGVTQATRTALLDIVRRLKAIEAVIDGVSGTIVTDHGLLTGLGDNDHPQYALDTDITAHLTDAIDAHDASAISFLPAGTIAATNVQAAIEEVMAEAGALPSDNGYAIIDGGTASDPGFSILDGGSA